MFRERVSHSDSGLNTVGGVLSCPWFVNDWHSLRIMPLEAENVENIRKRRNTMGKIILCRGKKADTPLTVLQTGVKLYTAEELCYYIYNNIYLIGQDFIDDNLISFLDETGEKELAERVRKLKETGGSLAQIFVIILKTIDYYSVAEIEQLKEILNTLGKQSVCERLKARGDGYLNAGYYFAAVRCYESIIKDYKGKDLLAADYAKVYHNLGTAYARMFMYDKAVIYYDEAYRTGQHEESKKCSIAALIMAKKDKEPVNVDVDEDEYVVQKELETLMDIKLKIMPCSTLTTIVIVKNLTKAMKSKLL